MRAVRAAKRHTSGGFTTHWLHGDGERTLCGTALARLNDPDVIEVEKLPAIKACLACERIREHLGKSTSPPAGRRLLQSSQGTLRTTGPLHHGTGHRSGRRL